jgi:tetratricopeptide (TPR) repeat protein
MTASPSASNGRLGWLRDLWERDWLKALLLVVAVLFAYQPAWHGGFIWDDNTHITANPFIVGPLGFKAIWTSSAATYYPLVLTSFWVQHAIWGLNPLPYHLVNIAMHAACVVLLWLVLRCLKVPGAWLGAALWGLHPVQTESVAWITELKNTQSCLFYLLAIRFFLKWRAAGIFAGRKGTDWDYALALLCAVLAILSKASTVMLPVVLGLIWWWNDGCWRWRNLFRLAPFFIISAAASGWTIWEQQFHSGAVGLDWSQSQPERLVIAGKVVWFYLGKLLWPHPLIFIYPRWGIDASRPTAYLPVLALGVTFLLLWLNRRSRIAPVFFAFVYFVVSLFPVLGFFKVYFFRYSFVGDHFQYLASLGPLALAAAGITTALDRFKKGKPFLEPVFCGTLLLVLGLLTWRQCGIYADVETLWRTTLARNPNSILANNNLGVILVRKGQLDEAIALFQKALQDHPDDPETRNNLAVALAKTHGDYANTLVQMGRDDEAMVEFRKALEFFPYFASARRSLAVILLNKGQVDEAIAQFQTIREQYPDDPMASFDLGNAYFQKGQMDEAAASYQRALKIKPDDVSALNNLGMAFFAKGMVDEAAVHFRKALALQPDFALARTNLAKALLKKERP